jgi:hypothetical protein
VLPQEIRLSGTEPLSEEAAREQRTTWRRERLRSLEEDALQENRLLILLNYHKPYERESRNDIGFSYDPLSKKKFRYRIFYKLHGI